MKQARSAAESAGFGVGGDCNHYGQGGQFTHMGCAAWRLVVKGEAPGAVGNPVLLWAAARQARDGSGKESVGGNRSLRGGKAPFIALELGGTHSV